MSGARAAHALPGDGELLVALREGLSPWLSMSPFWVRGRGNRMGMARIWCQGRSCLTWGWLSFWRRCARGCHLGSLSAHLPSGSVAEARGWGWSLWLLTRDWGVVRTGPSRELPRRDLGFESSDSCFLSRVSESRARTHRAPAQALSRSCSSRYVLRLCLGRRLRPISTNCLPSRSLRGAGYASACSLDPPEPVDGKHGVYSSSIIAAPQRYRSTLS